MTTELVSLLRATSRSFYLTLRVLPSAIRPQIGLAYLLARATDTIADTEIIPVQQRLQALADLRGRISGAHSQPVEFGELARHQGQPAERVLLERVEQSVVILNQLSDADKALVRGVLKTITEGQELDLRRFDGASEQKIISLQNASELDDYTYKVAGCVGEFWTQMCLAHLFKRTALETPRPLENGIRFGKGLQLVNILRDLPRDLRQGRCYIPADDLKRAGLEPADLLNPENNNRFRPVYNPLLDKAEGHLRAGWVYTNALPWISMRVRLACAWPVMIGMDTLGKLRSERVLDPAQRVKTSRNEVKWMMFRSVVLYPMPGMWKKMIR